MTPRFRTFSLCAAALVLTACGDHSGFSANWVGAANTSYLEPRTVYRAPVVQTNVRRLGVEMMDQYKRAGLSTQRIPGLRTRTGLYSSVVTPTGGSKPISYLGLPNTGATLRSTSMTTLPPLGRRRVP